MVSFLCCVSSCSDVDQPGTRLGASYIRTAPGVGYRRRRAALSSKSTLNSNTDLLGCSSIEPASENSQPSRAEAFAQAGTIMLQPSDLQLLLGDSCSVDTDYAPFR